MSTSRKPTHRLYFAELRPDGKGGPETPIGAGWQREDGTISIKRTLEPRVPGFENLRPIKEERGEGGT